MAQEQQEGVKSEEQEDLTQKTIDTLEIDLNNELTEEHEEEVPDVDYSQLSKEQLVNILENELASITAEGSKPAALKKAESVAREIRPVLDSIKHKEKETALAAFVAENGGEEGFEYKYDADTQKIDALSREIRGLKNSYYQGQEKEKEKNFNVKTALLQRLRTLLEDEGSKETDASGLKSSWEEFKKIQEEWKQAGNIASPHNGTLWATYNALIDRYFSNRNIYFELKELDRRRNAELKAELCEKVEELGKSLENRPMTREILNEANHIFEDYKHLGPAPKEDQEKLWQRFKEALDVLYNAQRGQFAEQKKSMQENYEQKLKIYEAITPFTTYNSGSIKEWNAKTKEIMAFQDQWVALKGIMPREEGKDLSKKFWAALKTFFNNKGEFFRQLESKREQNLELKNQLCAEAEAILETGEDNPATTQKIIELQKRWKGIGQVPEKFKDTIYDRFKKACDAYFDQKRAKNKEVEEEFENNLKKKTDLIERIEASANNKDESTLNLLSAFKSEWSSIGFVPKKDMQAVQKRYIAAINTYVSAIGQLSSKEKEQAVLESEVELVRDGESSRNLFRKESDIRRKITQLENDIALWQNNIEFFAKSKTSDRLKAEFERKINSALSQLNDLKHQLSIIQEAI
ncbi:DUF349 domain-containing protein [Dyadobacter chenwenxiniae]|uniref:DUF349 domain-containing protein n=1 Tax=Dyadobacter chenwenxiniae TaxID=2906456 RepID=A0A9X1PLQ2_9BACT|nr:DUF349 domain-containing protein [Dyadobacter chenwenxiniae]MCF0050664.1 DUF349 domain-containing protein [Dyadobacter chenwenxiniae]MCF0063173.1 DUF349 domain-containing protein [Dyadobacter chenwenxiniae]UON84659.1 DUF349 domain-containing protein [Dyadobacter chenwenxiniae]